MKDQKKLTYFHDAVILKDVQGEYFSTITNNKLFGRYKTISNNISAVLRVERSNNVGDISKIKGIKIYEVPNINSIRGRLTNGKRAKNIIKEAVRDSDYIIARIPSTIGYKAVEYAKKYNKPYLLEVVTCPFDAFWNHSLKGKVVMPYYYLKMRSIVKKSKYTVYVTKEFLQKRYPTNGHHTNISNVYLENNKEEILENRIKKIKSNKNKIIIGTVGHLNVKFKGQHYIIKSLSILNKHSKIKYEYQLVGDGDETRLKGIAGKYGVEKHVKFIGRLNHDEVLQWMDTIDVYAQPSKQEGLPRAVIEAMSRGTPVIGSNIAGIPELLDKRSIFNIKNKPVDNFIKVLNTKDKDRMLKEAKRNFEESKKYDYKILEKRRNDFFKLFKTNINHL